MGYASSYCEICGGPTNTVVASFDDGVEFEVQPQHEWLGRLVGLLPEHQVAEIEQDGLEDPPRVVRGAIDDSGRLVTEDGLDVTAGWMGGYLVVHESCWELAGQPTAEDLQGGHSGENDLVPYQQQYFDWGALAEAGEAWKLDPPLGDAPGSARNRQRIEGLTAAVRALTAGRPRTSPGTPRTKAKPAPTAKAKAAPPPTPPPVVTPTWKVKRLEKVEGTTTKFWEIELEGPRFVIRFGDVGGAQRMPFDHDCDGVAQAIHQAEDLVQSRLKDGFKEVSSR